LTATTPKKEKPNTGFTEIIVSAEGKGKSRKILPKLLEKKTEPEK
jgi:hypothetical protein